MLELTRFAVIMTQWQKCLQQQDASCFAPFWNLITYQSFSIQFSLYIYIYIFNVLYNRESEFNVRCFPYSSTSQLFSWSQRSMSVFRLAYAVKDFPVFHLSMCQTIGIAISAVKLSKHALKHSRYGVPSKKRKRLYRNQIVLTSVGQVLSDAML